MARVSGGAIGPRADVKGASLPQGTWKSDDRQRVLDATDIVQIVGEQVRLSPRGREFIGLCPFHDDHKPSMYVVPSKQIYHCFSCGAGGNAIDFVINYHKMEFIEALRFLAEKANVELTRRAGADSAGTSCDGVSRADLLAANAFALEFHRLALRHPEKGAEARRLLESRGVSAEMIERFQLGAAIDSWDALLATARRKGLAVETLLAAGLIKPPREGRGDGYDTQRRRVIFPIFDQIGRPIAFGGRKIHDGDEKEPKYLNSPETPIFDKSSTLYGLHLASREIQRVGQAIVTEGYTDVIACHQAGFTNAVGTLGTALTAKHARILQRLCSTIVLVFDPDEAGAKAADRAVEVFFSEPVDVKITLLPAGRDPANLLGSADGVEQFRSAIDEATDALEFRFDRLGRRLEPAGLSERSSALEEEMGRLRQLGLGRLPILRRQMVVRRLADLAGVDADAITRALRASGSPRRRIETGPAVATPDRPELGLEERTPSARALGLLLADPALLEKLTPDERDILNPDAYAPGSFRQIAQALWDVEHAERPGTAGLIARLEAAPARGLAARLVGIVMRENNDDSDRREADLRQCLRRAAFELEARNRPEPMTKSEQDGAVDEASIVDRIERRRRALAKYGVDSLAHAKPIASGSTGAG